MAYVVMAYVAMAAESRITLLWLYIGKVRVDLAAANIVMAYMIMAYVVMAAEAWNPLFLLCIGKVHIQAVVACIVTAHIVLAYHFLWHMWLWLPSRESLSPVST